MGPKAWPQNSSSPPVSTLSFLCWWFSYLSRPPALLVDIFKVLQEPP